MGIDLLRDMRDRLEKDARFASQQTIETHDLQANVEQRGLPDDLWVRCKRCGGAMFRDDFERLQAICSHCGYHDRLTAWQRIRSMADPDSIEELDASLTSVNPIDFPGYPEKIATLQQQTGLIEAIICARLMIEGLPCLVGAMDSRFMMASMGSVVGEKITRLFERATKERLPVIMFSASGGARMQEGIISLMQMAKTSAAVGRHHEAGLLYISVLTDPTTGGVTASFASLGDYLISEPGTLIGFAGRRVIEGTIAEELPADFQSAEFLLEHGFLDLIVNRSRLRHTLHKLLELHQVPAVAAAELTESAKLPNRDVADAFKLPDVPVDDESVPARSAEECLDLIRQKGRPVIGDYLPLVFDEAIELHGDRCFREDSAIYGGIGRLGKQPVTIIAHRKGRTLNENTSANFGMPHPEGYRKAMRLMHEAEKFGRPIICMIDTSGAYCGVGAEERGQGEAIARNLMEMMELEVPVIAVVMGEGGSGGALGIGVGDRLAMLSNSIYSVISPRGFASILWKDPGREREAANLLKITARDLKRFGICDVVLPEPEGGAHLGLTQMAATIRAYLLASLAELSGLDATSLRERRYQRFRRIGEFSE
ncbi:MAG: acetyl-CoA carboxylase carboxyltransferase subunit beta [Ruminococcaceae bacterium]|nr:acetyl-CoA carboxylase carboxyltransferase subunit beta [Oscillospiraceae bacterium]